ncbi:hypothetical protein ABB37_08575 [Leptomonas pyrrhocoris]|uniref:AAA+ ATPase domain-containing protein n=1 Tax=Leptomonas pyrrhocoris TaxID=157538 RepID=A0A0N0VDH0_LEPPY|nr:hypothetical protein ABB37_08575 [Leptomonas pyrrhocoris]KPA75274.1 hypothetical protein ABB37_08575 [Leptomonas pyrrhocoris]|eukprot:XP_015653713.1 hypothetical protein ABB37_08575 [Leptomonas pyrrhocoris]
MLSSAAQRIPPRASSSSSSPAAAPLLGVSRLTDYFTYGFQAAMTHYADHFCEEEVDEEEGIRQAAEAVRAGARYRNNFLTEQERCFKRKGANLSSLSSSTATYDSDAEALPPSKQLLEEKQEEQHFLEPQQTSLYRVPPSSSISHSVTAGSWSDAAPRTTTTHAPAASSSTTRHPLKPSANRAPASRDADWRSGHAQACFREALRRAYACEDTVREWRREEVNRQQEQLIRSLMLDSGGGGGGATSLNAAGNNLIEGEARTGQAARGRPRLAFQGSKQQQQRTADNAGLSSTLSVIAEYAQATEEAPGTVRAPASTLNGSDYLQYASNARARHAVQSEQQRSMADLLYAADDDDDAETEKPAARAAASTALMGTTAAAPTAVVTTTTTTAATLADTSSRHRLQVLGPTQLYKLRRTPNVLVDTVLKHHREAQRKQRAAQHAEDQAVRVRRLYELPVLTEDIVRYAALLLCLKRSHKKCTSTAGADPANFIGGGRSEHDTSPPSAGEAKLMSTPHAATSPTISTTNAGTTTTAAVMTSSSFPSTSDAADNVPPYGEEGSLLYMRYPAPLLRTTSFAVETVRLLKWLRTWRNSGSAAAGTSPSPPAPLSTPSSGGSQRKRVKTEVSTESRQRNVNVTAVEELGQPAASLSALGLVPAKVEARPVQRSTVEEAHKQLQHAQQLRETQARQEKRSAFLKFFGPAVAPSTANGEHEPVEVDPVESEDETLIANVKALDSLSTSSSIAKTEASSSSTTQQRTCVEEEDEETHITQQPLPRAPASPLAISNGIVQSPVVPPPPPLQMNPGVYAYQLYCHAWKHAVKTGITPLATAAQVFVGSRECTLDGVSPRVVGRSAADRPRHTNEEDCTLADSTAGTSRGVSRACKALPFYKEMQEEAQHTALGSATRGAYYEDAYGNRLRSARLAQKEREKQEQLAARRRRWAKKKGYFHRDDAEEGAAGRSAAAMLEAMLTSTDDSRQRRHAAVPSRTHDKKRRRERDSGSEDEPSPVHISDGDDDVQETAKPFSKKRTGRGRPRARSSSSDSSLSSDSSGSDSDVGEVANEGEAAAKDEITNIAVVSGPTGSGKTAAVYVAAQLLGFRVVEMNASVRRCAKTVEHLLAELTRSYRLSGLRAGPSGFNAEEELTKLRQQHAALVEKARAEAAAAEREAEQKRKEARKTNGISAQAVANFFSKGSRSSTAKKVGGDAAGTAPGRQQQRKTVSVDDAAEEDAVVQVPPRPPSPSSPPPPPPLPSSSSTAASPVPTPASSSVGTRTLLLFEDADILLGDESAKPFYAAIRDLAHRSKVPIVVTVSADSSPTQRYDTSLFLSPEMARRHTTSATTTTTATTRSGRSSVPLHSTYWQLCEEVGLNTPMDSLEAAYNALHASPVLGDRPSNAVTSDNATGSSSPDGATAHAGGNSPPSSLNGAASIMSLFPPSSMAACTGGPTVASGSSNNGAGATMMSSPAATHNGSTGSTSTTNSLAARHTHMLLSASLVSNFFGVRTPFTVVEALPLSALYAQLLAVGAVELDLLHWSPPSRPESPLVSANPSVIFPSPLVAGNSQQPSQLPSTPLSSSSSWQQDMDRLTSSLCLRDPALFFELAAHLRHALFGVRVEDTVEGSGTTENAAAAVAGEDPRKRKATLPREPTLSTAIQCDAAGRTTTDIRYWLNRLQMLLLSLRARVRSVQLHDDEALTSAREHDNPKCCEVPRPPRSDDAADEDCSTAAEDGEEGEAGPLPCRHAERLLEGEFQHYTSFAASTWDRALGQYMAHLSHNEGQSSRYEYWLLDDHVDYVADIVGELNTQNHPTLHVNYTSPPGAKSSPSPPPASARRGRPPSSSTAAAVNVKQGGKGSNSNPFPGPPMKVASTTSTSANTGSTSASTDGLNSSWKTLFGGTKEGGVTAAPTTLPGGQRTLRGSPRMPSTAGATPATSAYASGAVSDVPARYEWPPTLHELRKQANTNSSAVRLRPVELLLPYSTAQAYYDAVATSASCNALTRVPDVAEPSPLLLGHDTPLHFVDRQGGRAMIEEEGDYSEVRSELPSSVHVTQEERFAVFRRWWRRTRKVGALRDNVAGRSAAALEDMLGYGCLMLPSPAAASGNSGGS